MPGFAPVAHLPVAATNRAPITYNQSVSGTTTPGRTLDRIAVSLTTLAANCDTAASILSKFTAEALTVLTTPARTLLRSSTHRLTKTVAVAMQKSRQVAKRIKGKSGPRGTGSGGVPTFVSVGTIDLISAQSFIDGMTYPAGIQNKDIGIMACMWTRAIGNDPYPYCSNPAGGWQRFLEVQYGALSAVLWWKRLVGTESGGASVTLTGGSTSLGVVSGSISAWRGCIEDDTPVEVPVGTAPNASNPQVGATLATLGLNRLLITMFFNEIDNQLGTPGGSAAEHWDAGTNSGNDGSVGCYSLAAPTAGSNGPISRTMSGGYFHDSVSFALIPQPAGGSGSGQAAIDEAVGVASVNRTFPRLQPRTVAVVSTIQRATAKIIAIAAAVATAIDTGNETFEQEVSGTAGTAPSLRRTVAKVLLRTAAIATAISKAISASNTADGEGEAALVRSTTHRLAGQAGTVPTLSRRLSLLRRFTALAGAAGSIRKSTTHTLVAEALGAATLLRTATRTLLASASALGSNIAVLFRAYRPSLRRIIAGVERRLIIAKAELKRLITPDEEIREIEADEQDRRIIAPGEPRRRIIAPAEPDREAEPSPESRRIVPPPDA